MLQLTNNTPFSAERSILVDGLGEQHFVVAIKSSYAVEPNGRLTRIAPEPVALAPRYAGKPGASSLLRDHELVIAHPGTDISVDAKAHAPGGKALREMEIEVVIGSLRKRLSIVGDRAWKTTRGQFEPTEPEPFATMPIRYERAWGGAIEDRTSECEARNPIGVGFKADPATHEGKPLPNILDPGAVKQPPLEPQTPGGLLPIPPSWQPRASLAGTYDAAWVKEKAPLWPDDLDPRHFRSAAAGLWSETPFRGGEPWSATGLTASGRVESHVPREVLTVDMFVRGDRRRAPVQLDRVIIDLWDDSPRLHLVWRAALACGSRAREVERARVDVKQRLVR